MTLRHSPPIAVTARHSLHAMLVPFPAVCFTLTLLTDIAYWQTGNLMWLNFSSWLLFAGLVFGGLAVLVGILTYLFRREFRRGAAWQRGVGMLIVLGLALLNSLVHARDGWTAVVPQGLVLSAVTLIVILVTAWMGRSVLVRREEARAQA